MAANKNRFEIIVVSDTHGYTTRLRNLLTVINSADCFVFCGDGERDINRIGGEITVPMLCVCGNNDIGSRLVEYVTEELGGLRAFVTHGHKFGARRSPDLIAEIAAQNGCALALYGHTHKFYDGVISGVRVINPGALCNGSYAVVEISDGEITCRNEAI